MITNKHKVIIYAPDSFTVDKAKTAIGFIKYGFADTVAIVDNKHAGSSADKVISGLPKIPIVDSVASAKKICADADVLLIGIAPLGGRLPDKWLSDMENALKEGFNIVNGLHDFLDSYPVLNELAKSKGLFIWDVRKLTRKLNIANARVLDFNKIVVLTVGSDAAIGKMTVALELTKTALKRGLKAKFIATGQTGIMISGEGVPIDAIAGDFMAGAVEEEIIKAFNQGFNIVFVEGQGSILHPGWSGVTLALLHGSLPHKMVFCHKAGREYLKDTKVKIGSLKKMIEMYEYLSHPLRKSSVAGVALNTLNLDEEKARNEIKKVEIETGLFTEDVVKYSGDRLLNECLK